MDAMEISRTGLDVEWQRLQVIAQNLANMNSSSSPLGRSYRPLRLVSGPRTGFAGRLAAGQPVDVTQGVEVRGVQAMPDGIQRVFEPSHPGADRDGFVTYPAIEHATEMTLLIKTSRVYEANLTAMGIAQQMYSRAAEFGK